MNISTIPINPSYSLCIRKLMSFKIGNYKRKTSSLILGVVKFGLSLVFSRWL